MNDQGQDKKRKTMEKEPKRRGRPKKDNSELVCPRKEGESDKEYKRRCNRAYTKNHKDKKKAQQDESLQNALGLMKTADEAAVGEDGDFFLTKVVGVHNFGNTDGMSKHKECSKQVSTQLALVQILEKHTLYVNSKPEP